MRSSFGITTLNELSDALRVVGSMPVDEGEDAGGDGYGDRAIMVTSLGGVFSQGLDLTQLTHDGGGGEKQRKVAEATAAAIRR